MTTTYDTLISTARDIVANPADASAADLAYAHKILARHEQRATARSRMGLDAAAGGNPFRLEGSRLICDLVKKGGMSC